MKKINYYVGILFLASSLCISCSKNEGPGSESIQLDKGTQIEQTVYADEISKTESIKFNATAPWTAVVNEITAKARASEVEWLKLSTYEGGAGEHSLNLTLMPNLTGKDRMAEIVITCDDTVIRIRIEQKGTKQDGQKPTEPETSPMRIVNQIIRKNFDYINDNDPNTPEKVLDLQISEITYNKEGKFVLMETYQDVNTNYVIDEVERTPANLLQKTEMTYLSNAKAKAKQTNYRKGTVINFHTWDLQLNEAGYVVSSVSETNNDGFIENYTITYQDGYIASSKTTEPGDPTTYVETAVWDNGNLVKVTSSRGNNIFGWSEETYGNEVNPNLSIDLNFWITKAEFYEGLGEDTNCLKAFGFYGKRSKNLLVKEINKDKESSNAQVYEYTYTKNKEGLIESINVKYPVYPDGSLNDTEEYTWILKYQE